jgi:hypothetical protein
MLQSAGNIVERARDQFHHQQTAVVHRTRHRHPALRHRGEADTAVIGLVAYQQHEAVAFRLGVLQRAIQQRPADAATAKRRLDRQRSQQQSPGLVDAYGQLPHRAYQQRADPGRERQLQKVVDMLAQPVSAQHEAAGPEGTFVQALDRLRVIDGFRQDCEGEVAHGEARNSIWRRRGPSSRQRRISSGISAC